MVGQNKYAQLAKLIDITTLQNYEKLFSRTTF